MVDLTKFLRISSCTTITYSDVSLPQKRNGMCSSSHEIETIYLSRYHLMPQFSDCKIRKYLLSIIGTFRNSKIKQFLFLPVNVAFHENKWYGMV